MNVQMNIEMHGISKNAALSCSRQYGGLSLLCPTSPLMNPKKI
ncbi:MAG: hypothetical protein ACFWUM_10345 [Eubacteriales bacterium]|jgi:hypothetical protein